MKRGVALHRPESKSNSCVHDLHRRKAKSKLKRTSVEFPLQKNNKKMGTRNSKPLQEQIFLTKHSIFW
jgi:hypothetical protein